MKKINIMINGLPGKMAETLAKKAAVNSNVNIVPYSFTGPEIKDTKYNISDESSSEIMLIKPEIRQESIGKILRETGSFISIDFTSPYTVKKNVLFYCKNKLPFVLGTTGCKQDFLVSEVKKALNIAIYAPNMARQIIGLQAMFKYGAKNFPNIFKDYHIEIKESHQNGKADTSGTAKTMVEYFKKMGLDVCESDIQKERDPIKQKNCLKIPEAYIDGHAWHTYSITSNDGTVFFEIKHNINGRNIYANGALEAVFFLDKKIEKGCFGKLFTMLDVLSDKI